MRDPERIDRIIWSDWHRGHGCDRDDGKPRSAEAQAEIDGHEATP